MILKTEVKPRFLNTKIQGHSLSEFKIKKKKDLDIWPNTTVSIWPFRKSIRPSTSITDPSNSTIREIKEL